jgi:hypothetical protein
VGELAKVLLLVGEGEINHGFVLLRCVGTRQRALSVEVLRPIDWSVSQRIKGYPIAWRVGAGSSLATPEPGVADCF